MKKNFLLALSCFFVSAGLFAQDQQQKITYHGQFRTLVGDYNLSGNILEGDTASARRGSEGTMFFDFGIQCKPNENFKFLTEFRFRNVIGLDLASSNLTPSAGLITNNIVDARMIFRQVRVEGNIKNVVQYQIGDIDLGLTKYTLFGNDEIFHSYESDIFRRRRAISQYETFQNGNLWRLQGASAKTQINFKKVIERVDLSMFGTRTRHNNFDVTVPDRFLVGGKLDVLQSKFLSLGVNWSNFFDVMGTSSGPLTTVTTITPTGQTSVTTIDLDTAYNYNNQVLSLSYKITPYNNDKYEVNVVGESGFSKNKYFIKNLDTTAKKDDYFIDAGLRVLYKPKKVELSASYINVGADFTSPGAQTLRLNALGRTNLLGSVFNNTAYRVPTIFDRYASDFIYNQRIQTGLMMFLPLYGNVLPYGAATPNRSGLVFNIGRLNEPNQVISANLGGAMLSEIVSEGDVTTKELRKFLQLKGGVALKVSNIVGFKKNIVATVGGRYENTNRTGNATVDYKSVLLDGGLTVEVVKDVSLMGGVKYLHGNGVEVLTVRNVFGSITGFSPYVSDITQTVVSGGVKIDLFTNSFASVEYNNVLAKNNLNVDENYKLGNLFFNFTLRF